MDRQMFEAQSNFGKEKARQANARRARLKIAV
jgi:hypothetical protein